MSDRLATGRRDVVRAIDRTVVRPACDRVRNALEADGFVAVRQLFKVDDVREVECFLDALLLAPSRATVARRRDLSDTAAASAPRQPEISRPTLGNPRLRRTLVYLTCAELAADLLGGRAHYLFDHAIYKMPRSGTRTPWHQDLAYLGQFAAAIRSLHFWIPLQDTNIENGALCFVAGSHRWPLLGHVPAYATNPHVLTTVATEHLDGQYVALACGDVSIHTSLTLHASGPNQTDGIRKAWIIHFGDTPAWRKHVMKITDRVRQYVTSVIP